MVKHMQRHGGDPLQWLEMWSRVKKLDAGDRVMREMKVVCDCLYYGGVYDQVNMAGLASFEVIARRVQSIVDAYVNPSKPDWSNARHFSGAASPEDLVSPQFRGWAARKAKDELDLTQARSRQEKHIGHTDTAGDGAADSGAATAAGRGRGRGRGKLGPAVVPT